MKAIPALIFSLLVSVAWVLWLSYEADRVNIKYTEDTEALKVLVEEYKDALIKTHFKLIECQEVSYNCLRNHKP